MEYRNLGNSGLKVSAVGLGCNNFGMRNDTEQTRAIVHRSLDEGITLFDTADIYGNRGASEEMLGKALGERRRDAVVATKFGMAMGDGPYLRGGSRRYVIAAAEASLKRLGTDYIDLYQIHQPDPETPQQETLEALNDLVRAGKVRYIGSSNFAAWQAVDAHWISRANGLASYVSAQNQYNLLDRRIERELVPACRQFGVGILPYFPLASGFLTGKYRRGAEPPKGTRLSLIKRMADQTLTDENFAKLERLDKFARDHNHTLLELAVGWLASQPQVSSVISGATSPEQVTDNVKAGNWKLTSEELAEV
ncbi:MAG TPA: aldo/keto reductase, partial [Sporolactobacillaceae bacterium]|nr:aldo/keto reductase [Sporolactobacillaceae bacterium]